MSKNYAFTAEVRERAGKGVARSLRREGKIPAVIYGDKKEPVKIQMSENAANVEYNKGRMFTTLCELDLAGEKHILLARDIQLHPVTDVVEHVDFLRVTKKTKIAVSVPVNFVNENDSPGLDQKGILNVVRYTVELLCSAMDIPEALDVNLAGKEIGDAIKVSDAAMPEGASPVIDDRDFTIATIVAPKTAAEEEAEEAEADAEIEASEAGDQGDAAEGGEEASSDA